MQLQSTLTCPKCSHRAVETMPTDACQFFYDCKGCGDRLKPLSGDCCVFCSYGSVPTRRYRATCVAACRRFIKCPEASRAESAAGASSCRKSLGR